MGITKLKCGAEIHPAKRIKNINGDVMHALKSSDEGFIDFGEAYFSTVHQGLIKGWKKHLRMTMNLLVPVGEIRFYLMLEGNHSKAEQVTIGEGLYARLFVPPGVWVAFEGIGAGLNLLLNVASIEHDPLESVTSEFKI